jgi:hypothetical protein
MQLLRPKAIHSFLNDTHVLMWNMHGLESLSNLPHQRAAIARPAGAKIMSTLLFTHPAHSATLRNGIALPKVPAAFLATLAMATAFLAASGVVLFALNAALATH